MKFGLRELVFLLMLMAIPLGSYMMIFRPQDRRQQAMAKEIEAKKANLAQLTQTTARIGNIETEVQALEKGIESLQAKLPSEKEIDKVLQEVWRLAEANKLTTKSIRTLDKTPDMTFASASGPHAEQPIMMKLEGDFMGFYAFMLALEDQPRIMRIRKMTLTKPDKAPDGFMQAAVEMTIFFEQFAKDQI